MSSKTEIPKLISMPTFKKDNGSFRYEERYVGKLFQIGEKIVYFKKNSFEEYSFELFSHIKNFVLNELEKKIKDEGYNDKQIERIEKEKEELKQQVLNLEDKIKKLENKKQLKISDIDDLINQKLVGVHNNFQKMINDIVKKAVEGKNRDASGKLKLSTLILLKELGMSPSEIKGFSESGLI